MIRKGHPNDIDEIMNLCKDCTKHMMQQGIFQWNMHYPNVAAFENDVKRDELFVLEMNHQILGTIVISSFMDEDYAAVEWLTQNKNNIYIHRLAVHPEYQSLGFAQQLMDFAEAFATKNNYLSIRLDTFSQNKRNQQFYEKRGYQKLGHIYFPKQSTFPFYCYELVL